MNFSFAAPKNGYNIERLTVLWNYNKICRVCIIWVAEEIVANMGKLNFWTFFIYVNGIPAYYCCSSSFSFLSSFLFFFYDNHHVTHTLRKKHYNDVWILFAIFFELKYKEWLQSKISSLWHFLLYFLCCRIARIDLIIKHQYWLWVCIL